MNNLQLQTKIIIGSLSGLLLSTAFSNNNLWFLMPISFAILWGIIHKRLISDYLVITFSFCLVFWATHITWIIAIGLDAYILLTLLMSLIYGLTGLFMYWSRNIIFPFFWYAMIFIGIETLTQIFPFGGFPWAKIAYGSVDAPWSNLASFGSTQLVAFGILFVSILLIPLMGFIVQKSVFPTLVFLISISAILLFYQSLGNKKEVPISETAVLLVQGSVPRSGLFFNEQKYAVLENHITETKKALATKELNFDAILWPENSIDVDPFRDKKSKEMLEKLLKLSDKPIFAGAVLDSGSKLSNSVLLINNDLDKNMSYTKVHLVPFGEYIPFRNLIEGRIGRLNLISKDFKRGVDFNNLKFNDVIFSPVICFEVAWNDVLSNQILNGAQFISVHTNNATYAFTNQIKQQFEISRFRAKESGREVVISATTGISAHISREGKVLWKSDEFMPNHHVAKIELYKDITFAVKYNTWINISIFFVLIILIILILIDKVRSRL